MQWVLGGLNPSFRCSCVTQGERRTLWLPGFQNSADISRAAGAKLALLGTMGVCSGLADLSILVPSLPPAQEEADALGRSGGGRGPQKTGTTHVSGETPRSSHTKEAFLEGARCPQRKVVVKGLGVEVGGGEAGRSPGSRS